jgi:radical SAM protein (TIGR01212 family)
MNRHLIHTFGVHCREKHGMPVGKVTLETGYPCPNRARGGCIYCAPDSFRPVSLQKGDPLEVQLDKGKRHLEQRRGLSAYLAYFQQETSTAGPADELARMFRFPLLDPTCKGVIISTRPDFVGADLLRRLAAVHEELPDKEILVELGLQSVREETLRALNRNHSYADFVGAVGLLRRYPFIQAGAHLILGLPGEGEPEMLGTIRSVCRLGIDYLKLHHLQVLRGTKLHEMYVEKPFRLPGVEEYLDMLARLLAHIPYRVVLHRLWSNAPERFLVEPRWGLKTSSLRDALLEKLRCRGFFQGSEADDHG